MDSGNSGSLQSSSGGDEEYESRAADSVPAFMPISNQTAPLFDPLSTYLQLPNSSFLNTNLSWPRISSPSLRSDPNPLNQEAMLPSFMPTDFQPTTSGGFQPTTTAAPPHRNPKKRSRASRRAPTTVLTTDTTNFRAMVQEFTGIPAPPFNTTSAFPRTRLDLFAPRSQPPPYLRRPFAQKVHPPHPFLASSSSSSLLVQDSTNNSAAAASSSTLPSINYQLPITNTFDIPNQNILSSLLQSNPKFPFSTSSSKLPQNSFQMLSNDDHQTKVGGLELDDQFGLSNVIPADHNDKADTSSNAAARWSNNVDERVHLNGGYDFQRNAMSGKMTTTSGFLGGKAPENVASTAVRGEGMVESWICSSE